MNETDISINNSGSQNSYTSASVSTPVQNGAYIEQTGSVQQGKTRSKWKKIFAIAGIFVILLGVFPGYLIFQGIKDGPQVQREVTDFLQRTSDNDLEGAYSMASDEFKKSVSKEDFIRTITLLPAQYKNFKEQKQEGFSVEANAGQPNLFKYSGTITYTDGDSGTLSAVLIKEAGGWKILSMTIYIDTERLEKFSQTDSGPVLGVSTDR